MAVIRDIMPEFELFQPSTIEDALVLLDQHGTNAWVFAGGLDTFDWLKDRIKRPTVVVDLGTIKELKGIREVNGGLEIGAMTTLTEVVRNPIVKQKFSILSQGAEAAASPQIRTREPSAATFRRMRAAGITGAAGNAIARAATCASRIHRRRSTANTPSWARTVAWR